MTNSKYDGFAVAFLGCPLYVGQLSSGGDGADFLYGDGTQGSLTVGGQDIYTLPQFHGDDYLDGGAGNGTCISNRRHIQHGRALEMEARP